MYRIFGNVPEEVDVYNTYGTTVDRDLAPVLKALWHTVYYINITKSYIIYI